MIVKKLTAVFGRLEGETLELHEGLNVITAPNEAGKSTWGSFFLAMLYGVDTSERASRNSLPVKTKYLPWSGRPMEGTMELLENGRSVTVERTTAGKAPMGAFRAWDTNSGVPLDVTGDGFAARVLGVERSVYERTGFLTQPTLALTADHALEARLSALVSSGEETLSAAEALERLRAQRNRCRHNRTGLLPQAEEELSRTEASLEELRRLGKERMDLEARLEGLEARAAELQAELDARAARDAGERQQMLEAARLDLEKKTGFLREKEDSVRGLPSLEELQDLQRQLEELADAAAQAEETLDELRTPPREPACPPVLAGLTADQVRDRADADCAHLTELGRPPRYAPRTPPALFLIAAITLIVAVIGLVMKQPAAALAGGFLTVLSCTLGVVRAARNRRALEARRQILAPYGVADASALRRMAEQRREALLLWQQQSREWEVRRRNAAERRGGIRAQQAELLREIAAFAPQAEDLSQAAQALRRAVHLRQFHAAAQREADQAAIRAQAVTGALRGGDQPVAGTSAELEDLRRDMQALRSQLDLRAGRMEALGDPAALEARREQLATRIEALLRRYDALTMAMEALEQADGTLRSRFAPQICRLAGEYLSKMTGGRYDHLILQRDLTIRAQAAGDAVTRPAAALSSGTADQLYLAVRLAVSGAVLPPDAPLVLDDALLTFDDERLGAAMELLLELSKTRQILLFTCQSREQAWLDAHRKDDPSC